ncbi:MAG: AsmA family protein [Alphaproteobacteria bacterium]|nr:AsmA family protein [Alphaproteobacteria bacterium]MBU1514766.1 AsmA family protein [Alphaproteobacteria bacterium]MBU2093897.1 AsmA family protein [Alphaproteobacteria bacterium]MBU2153324.1 AsmA family protein [Alphaproteobacteria bacterium]MBU2309752.1 AsmA family protein [Alphaproteobacteria bacterium]
MTWTGAILAILAIIITILILIWDWNWFRGPLERAASAKMHREVTIAGDLNVNLWSWQPSATVDGISIANPAWAGTAKMGTIDRLRVRVRLVPLLWGKADLRVLAVERPNFSLLADAKGRKNWDFSDGRVKAPMNLPPIQQFVIQDGTLKYLDAQREVRFEGTINAREQLGDATRGFELLGRGTINGAPFKAEVVGGPLLNIERSKPYPFDVELQAGRTYITARGAVPKPFDMGQFYMNATARGPDMAQLFPLTGVALPNTPPYSLRGRLSRDGLLWKVDNLSGRVGDSDLSGDASIDTAPERPFLKANLSSQSLDWDDLGPLFGAAPKAGAGETLSPEQAAMAKTMVAQQRLLPDAPLDVSRIRAMDADVSYSARSIRDTPVKLNAASVRVRLDNGMLRAQPLKLELPRGEVSGYVNLDARKAVPVTDLDLRMTNSRIETLIPFQFQGTPALTGALVGRARLTGAGDSVHKAFASADGQVTVVAPGGEIRKAFAELAGVNVIKGLGLLDKKDTTPINCAVASFETKGGVMRANNIVFDTGPVLITGKGTVNLGTERMNFEMRGHDKKLRVGRVLLPVTIKGPLMAPKLGVEPGSAIAQGGAAVALGSFLSPLAAILPFIDPGLAKDANCGALLAAAQADGAPINSAPKALTAKR